MNVALTQLKALACIPKLGNIVLSLMKKPHWCFEIGCHAQRFHYIYVWKLSVDINFVRFHSALFTQYYLHCISPPPPVTFPFNHGPYAGTFNCFRGIQGRILKKQENLTMVVSVMEPKLLMKMLQVTLTGGPGGSRRPPVRQVFIDTAAADADETTRGSEGSVFSEDHVCLFTMKLTPLREQNLTSRKLCCHSH